MKHVQVGGPRGGALRKRQAFWRIVTGRARERAAQTFMSPDARVSTVSSGLLPRGGVDSVMTIGEIRLPDTAGTVLIMGLCSDPAQRQELTVLTAFALSMTQYLPEGIEPQLPEGARFEAPLDGE